MKKITFGSIAALAPALAFAQTINDIVGTIGGIIQAITPIVVALALLYFFWGLAKYILAAGDEGSKQEGKGIMIWGIIALFVMVAVWGLVQVLVETFGVEEGGTQEVPTVNIGA